MTDEQRAAYIVSQAAVLMAEIASMQAENQFRAHRGEAPAYVEEHFSEKIRESGLGHNDVMTWLRG